jgi:hypothetical protein
MSYTNFPNGITSLGVPVVGGIGGIPLTGNWYFLDYVNGADGNEGTPDNPLKTLAGAHARMTAGNNDVAVIMGDGGTAATQRLSETLAWTKNACHIIGMTAPTGIGQRARIAPVAATTAFANFVTVSASGCIFVNFSVFDGFDTGTTNQIAWTDSGQRNYYWNVQLGGMGDAASAQNTGSRSLKLTGSESTFDTCTIGLDTVTRTVANASLELSGAATRNVFRGCLFPVYTSSATTVIVKTAAAAAIDRFTLFEGCKFLNASGSGSTTMTGVAIMAASAGGYLLFKDCTTVGISSYGYDAATKLQAYVDGAVPTGATTGIAVAAA